MVVFIVGFARHGINFIKYGFIQTKLDDLLDKLATKEDINDLWTEVNHSPFSTVYSWIKGSLTTKAGPDWITKCAGCNLIAAFLIVIVPFISKIRSVR